MTVRKILKRNMRMRLMKRVKTKCHLKGLALDGPFLELEKRGKLLVKETMPQQLKDLLFLESQ